MDGTEDWSHNSHYHRIVFEALRSGHVRSLDVGCGLGGLTRKLRQRVPDVTGVDRDARSIELARSHPRAGDIAYVCGDYLTASFEGGLFDLISAVASLHHVDEAMALVRMRDLLRPGGVLVVIGLARGSSLTDLMLTIPAVIGSRIRHRRAATRDRSSVPVYQAPLVWPPPSSYRDIRLLAERILPGVRYRRHLYWRYSLVWSKPV